jgi:glucose-6-phosphate 1-dehydrogenase
MDEAVQRQILPDQSVPPAGPCTLVIFGATGDLAKRLLMPALYNLAAARLLPKQFAILGVSSSELTTEQLRRNMSEAVQAFATAKDSESGAGRLAPEVWDWLMQRLVYLQGDFADPQTYMRLRDRLAQVERDYGTRCNYLFYLATPDNFFGTIIRQLGEAGLAEECSGCWRRVIIEKPFGHDLASARSLNRQILSVLSEDQIYRIDHFLGKETVQNIMVLRFANGFFEPIWNREHIDHVQITAAETVGVEQRGRFYDATGALRDMVPNHLFQLFAMTAMAPPNSFDADAVRAEKAKVVDAVQRFDAEEAIANVVRGQYGPGMLDGRTFEGYRREPKVAPDSETESYVALKLMVENWRWAGVPFYLRTGKAMRKRRTEIAISFKQAPFALFRKTGVETLTPNWLVLRIQPDEGASFEFGAKMPGPLVRLDPVRMDFSYKDYFAAAPNTGYETLIYDCMIGDATLFQRADNIEAGWSVVQPILDSWASGNAPKPALYAAGSSGPEEADALLARDGRKWREIV